jgi:uncharacterized SAM-binding protein YcdF (DUF218 family)
MKRSEMIFKHFGFNVTPMATGFNVKENEKFSLFPKEENFHKSYQAIHEYFGILSLLLRGYKRDRFIVCVSPKNPTTDISLIFRQKL